MSEEIFQRARAGTVWDRIGYVSSLDFDKREGLDANVFYMPDGCHWTPFLGYTSMCVLRSSSNLVFVYRHAFDSDFILTEEDFKSVLFDHEFVHLRQKREGRLVNRSCKQDGRFSSDLGMLLLPEGMPEEEARRMAYHILYPSALYEIEAYKNQLRVIETGRRNCSDTFFKKMRERLTIYQGVL